MYSEDVLRATMSVSWLSSNSLLLVNMSGSKYVLVFHTNIKLQVLILAHDACHALVVRWFLPCLRFHFFQGCSELTKPWEVDFAHLACPQWLLFWFSGIKSFPWVDGPIVLWLWWSWPCWRTSTLDGGVLVAPICWRRNLSGVFRLGYVWVFFFYCLCGRMVRDHVFYYMWWYLEFTWVLLLFLWPTVVNKIYAFVFIRSWLWPISFVFPLYWTCCAVDPPTVFVFKQYTALAHMVVAIEQYFIDHVLQE